MRPAELESLRGTGHFVAEVGVGVVHHERVEPLAPVTQAVRDLNQRVKAQFDPAGRLNPGVRLLPAP